MKNEGPNLLCGKRGPEGNLDSDWSDDAKLHRNKSSVNLK